MNDGLKVVFGRRTVEEYLRSSGEGELKRLVLCETNQKQMNEHLSRLAGDKHCDVATLPVREFDEQARRYKFTQGVILYLKKKSADEGSLSDYLKEKKPRDIVLLLDHLEDVMNFGSILRTAGFYGVGLVIIPKDRAADITPAVEKVSSGALASVKVAEVTNLNNILDVFKKNDYWVVGTSLSPEARSHSGFKWPERTLLVIGNEHKGLSRLLEKNCDFLLKIEARGRIESLNAAVSTAVFLDGYFQAECGAKK